MIDQGGKGESLPAKKTTKKPSISAARLVRLQGQIVGLKESERQLRRIQGVLQKKTHALGERVKELRCLYAISNIVEKPGLSLDKMLEKILRTIPVAWQYPEITCARIVLDGKVIATANFSLTRWIQSAPVVVKRVTIGSLDLCYLEERPPCYEGPFLREERSLIKVIAERIGEVIERKRADDALRETMLRNRALLNAIPDTIFRIDREGMILDFKEGKPSGKRPRFKQIVGMNVRDLPGRYPWLPRDVVEKGMDCLRHVLGTGETEIYEQRIAGFGEAYFYFEVLVTMSGKDEVLGIIRDITERRLLEKQVLEISEWEQQRIGQDLHDSLCQQLTGVAFLGKVLEQKMVARGVEEASDAGEIVSLVDEAITQTRGLARGLYPVRVEAEGLMAALSALSQNVERVFGIVCRFSCPGPVLVYDSSAAIHLYRIAQEAVNNAMKHGKASEIAISLRRDDGGIVLEIQNDGLQFRRPPADRRGLGISIMKYRATMIGATFDIRGAGNGGAVVTCSLPDGPDPDQCRQGGE